MICKYCDIDINTDIYSCLRATINDKIFHFCAKKCLDSFLEFYEVGDGEPAIERVVVFYDDYKNRWEILDL